MMLPAAEAVEGEDFSLSASCKKDHIKTQLKALFYLKRIYYQFAYNITEAINSIRYKYS